MSHNLWYALWQDNSEFGRLIVLVLIVSLIRAAVAATRNLGRFKRETASLDRVVAKLREGVIFPLPVAAAPARSEAPLSASKAPPLKSLDSAKESVDQVDPAMPALVDVSMLKEGVARDSLIYERLEAIEKLRVRRVKVSTDALQQLSLAREEARPGMGTPGLVASMATMLGLLGTFVGLASMVQQIQFTLPDGAPAAADLGKSLGNVFSVLVGIKTAFSCSLMGMSCAVVASLFAFRLRGAQARFFEKLERFTIEELLPATLPAVEDESLLEQLSFQLDRSFSRLDAIFAQNQEALKDLTGAQQAFVEIVQEVRQITRGEASHNLDRVIEQLAQTNRSVLSVVDLLPKMVSSIENGQRRLVERLMSLGERPASASVVATAGPRLPYLGLFIVLALVAVGLAIKIVWFH